MRVLILLICSQLLLATKVSKWQSNGVPVWFVENKSVPMLDIAYVFDAGSTRDGKLPGISALVNESFFEGCGAKSANAVSDFFESNGAEYDADKGYDGVSLNLRVLTDADYLLPVVQQFAQCLSAPKFDTAKVEHNKKLLANEWQQRQLSGFSLAIKEFKSQFYGAHAYANFYMPTPKALSKISSKDLGKFYREFYNRANGHLVLVGSVNIEQAKQIAEIITKATHTGKAAPKLKALKPHRVHKVDLKLPKQVQTSVVIGLPGIKYNQDSALINLANYPFGSGSLSSRLYKTIREKNGYVYSINSMFVFRKHAGEFYILFRSRPEVAQQAINEVLQQLHKYQAQGPTEEEFVLAKKSSLQSLYQARASNSGLINELRNLVIMGQDLDYFTNLPSMISGYKLAEARAKMRALLTAKPVVMMVENNKAGK